MSAATASNAAAVAASSSEGSLLAVIGDEDTVTGFLLAGIGNLDARRKSNFLIVKPDTSRREMEDAFKTLGHALEILTTPMQRQLYDEGYDREAIIERAQAAQRAAHKDGGHGHGH